MTKRDLEEHLLRVGNFSREHARALAQSWWPRVPNVDGNITYHVKSGPLEISKLSSWTDAACEVNVPEVCAVYDALLRRLKR